MSMSDENNNHDYENEVLADDSEETSLVDEKQKLEEENKELKRKYDDIYDRFVRLAADFDNYKKRLTKEKTDVQNYGNEELVKSLLNVLDNLERAINHSRNTEQSKGLLDGVQLVYDQFINCLEKFNVKVVESGEGVEFNPKYHEAIERVESDKYESGIIISEMVKGYTLRDRLIRPSMVSVSKGKTQKEDETKTEDIDDKEIFNLETDGNIDSDTEIKTDDSEEEDIIDLTEETNK